ncbi:MAG: E3 binding domain-containing protein [bacterium]|nr:E3 binding domain-containing protein [bacterium]
MTAVTEIRLPQFGMGMQEGTIIAWRKREGDQVAAGEVVAEIEAEKVTEELVATGDGVLQRILVPEGETVAVNELLAVIGPAGAVEPDTSEGRREAVEHERGTVAAPDRVADRPAPAPAVAGSGPGRQITPRARRLAAELGIDLDSVVGTGPGGRVTEDDVKAAADPSPAS